MAGTLQTARDKINRTFGLKLLRCANRTLGLVRAPSMTASVRIDEIEGAFRARTPRSAATMERAARSMPNGITRGLSWHEPYPTVFERGEGAHLHDIDGNRYLDLAQNGLSLIHGHAYPPVVEALRAELARGTAWPGASDAQVAFAELLCSRIPHAEMVRFTNTGTEAMMLAVKLARAATGRPMVVKTWHAYHGSYDDLEAGLHGNGELPGRVALADFGDIESFARVLDDHSGQVAAIVLEPVLYTGVVTPPPPGFLADVERLARDANVLVVLDDCLMFRLAEGGSAERFGLAPDITCVGKWIGGGLPVGAIAASAELMAQFDVHRDSRLYHGGSFNGNPLGCVAGAITLEHFTAARIEAVDERAARFVAALQASAEQLGLSLRTPRAGSAFGIYLANPDDAIDWASTSCLHLAASNRGVTYGPGGECGISTAIRDDDIDEAITAMHAALVDVARRGAGTPTNEQGAAA
jgi:glutamate-1-semialdehyde 2,1-aminomutase